MITKIYQGGYLMLALSIFNSNNVTSQKISNRSHKKDLNESKYLLIEFLSIRGICHSFSTKHLRKGGNKKRSSTHILKL